MRRPQVDERYRSARRQKFHETLATVRDMQIYPYILRPVMQIRYPFVVCILNNRPSLKYEYLFLLIFRDINPKLNETQAHIYDILETCKIFFIHAHTYIG